MPLGFSALAASAWADELEATGDETLAPTPETPFSLTSGNKFYLKMQKVAAKLLKRFYTGTVILVSTTQTETGNPLDPFVTVSTTKKRNAYVGGYSDERIGRSNGLILASDRRIVLDSTGVANFIKSAQELRIDGVSHTIVTVKPIPAAGITSVYLIQARTANSQGSEQRLV